VIAILTARVETALENGRITQERADAMIATIEERVVAVINSEANVGGRLRERFMMGLRPDRMALIESAMEATGLTRGQILGQLIDGATLGSVIAENGGDVNAIIAAAAANATERLDQAVANGRITQEQADQMLQRLNEMLQDAMNGTLRQSRRLL
jgi:bifunctional N-acetylglucosamine-1-phosphate-uridyltransferase/glucosamine-1-phosphate-acetyltransferase GlmU-like protein